jgi:hypothetical protein
VRDKERERVLTPVGGLDGGGVVVVIDERVVRVLDIKDRVDSVGDKDEKDDDLHPHSVPVRHVSLVAW